MRNLRPTLAAAVLVSLAAEAAAADLAKINRTLAREPAYQTGAPRYCLLVFGREARTRVWLVLDGNTLYVDRNGNGDLTEPGEKVVGKNTGEDGQGMLLFEAGDLRDGALTHRNLAVGVGRWSRRPDPDDEVKQYLARDPQAPEYALGLDVELPGRKGPGPGGRVEHGVLPRDGNGFLRFSERPQDAPVIHFGGPMKVYLRDRTRLTAGRAEDVIVRVGTPGLGPGTTASLAYKSVIPESASPRLEISLPPQKPGEPQVQEVHNLTHRC